MRHLSVVVCSTRFALPCSVIAMGKTMRLSVQLLTYAVFAACLVYLSASLSYDYSSADRTTVKLSLSHAADRVEPCIKLSPQEVAELAPNMRQAQRCERERLPLHVQLDIDGDVVVDLEAKPSGLWKDGPASIYERFEVPSGRHRVTVRLRDTAREDGWDYSHTQEVDFPAGRYFTVTFRAESGGFSFR